MFIDFGLKDIIDILLVALMLYYVYRLMRESRSLNIFVGILIFIVIWLFVSQILEMRLLGTILDKLVSVGVIALIVLFQDEIRKFFYNIGAHQHFRRLKNLFSSKTATERQREDIKQTVMPVVMACLSMSKNKVGALIVIERASPLTEVIRTGDILNADINQRLLENIFFKNSPLHDGAVVIVKQQIRPRYTQGVGTTSPLRSGYLAGERCHCYCCQRGDGHYFHGRARQVPPPPVGRGVGEFPDSKSGIASFWQAM